MTARHEGSARDRLLAAADTLFYADGVNTVGIDRILAEAGVAKASLYSTFGSKDALVQAYIEGRAERRRARIEAWLERYDDPKERLLAIFDLLAESAREPSYRGCAFLNANAEGGHSAAVDETTKATRAWVRERLVELARGLGVRDAKKLGGQVAVLYDGAMVAATIERDLDAIKVAKAMAGQLADAAKRR